MRSLAVQKCGSSSRCGRSRRHSRRGLSLSPNSSRATPSAAAETQEGRGQKAHAALGRVLSSSRVVRNAKADRLVSNAKADRVVSNAKVVSSVKNAKVL
jgi:hypothetical protein